MLRSPRSTTKATPLLAFFQLGENVVPRPVDSTDLILSMARSASLTTLLTSTQPRDQRSRLTRPASILASGIRTSVVRGTLSSACSSTTPVIATGAGAPRVRSAGALTKSENAGVSLSKIIAAAEGTGTIVPVSDGPDGDGIYFVPHGGKPVLLEPPGNPSCGFMCRIGQAASWGVGRDPVAWHRPHCSSFRVANRAAWAAHFCGS